MKKLALTLAALTSLAAPAHADITVGFLTSLSGPGASNLAISGNNAVQVLSVNQNATVTLYGVTIENGLASGGGGGILNSGMLTWPF